MIKNISTTHVVFATLIMVLSGCVFSSISTPPSVTSTPALNTLPVSTRTLTPTNTPTPTKTLLPSTATASVPEKSLDYLTGVKVIYIDRFDKPLSNVSWHFSSGPQAVKGVLKILGIGGNDWNSVASRRDFKEGNGIVIDFTYTNESIFQAYVAHGIPSDSVSYKAFAIYFEKDRVLTNVWAGNNSLGGENLPGNFELSPDTNYSLLVAIIPDGEFLMVIWEPAKPSNVIFYREKIGKNWSHLTWDLGFGVNKGILFIDNYKVLTFDSAK